MIIGIDASRANKFNKTGTEWYSWHLIEELKKIIGQDDKVLLYANSKLEGGLENMPGDNWQERMLSWPPVYLWTQIRLWWELFVRPPDVLLVPAHTIPLLPIRWKIRVIATVHDVGFRRFPELYKPIQVWYHELTMRRIKSRADIIITISEFSKKEIIDLYRVNEEKIKVVHLGFDAGIYHEQSAEDISAAKENFGLADPYIMYIGRLEKKKNIGNIVKAYVLARANHENIKLVLAGSSGNQFDDIKNIISDLKLEKEIILPGYVDQADLPKLLAGASAFIFPTLYEGFGLPILESMAVGTPVITSNTLPHTEVGGDAAIYVDPKSPEAISDAIIKVLENEDFRRQVVESGVLRANEFSWKKTAEEIYRIIK
jgi:glycosyltransferase involved in cell wall biosynthesis